MGRYEPVPKVPDFPAMERRWLAAWKERDTFGKLRARNADGEPWSFLDGPITANNPMGVHHAWGRSYKDMFQRYHAMRGRRLRYQNGFDCQGLWVEVEVEKEKGFASKGDIAAYGLGRFVRDCKARVLTYAARQTEQSIRLGSWMEWDDPATLLALRDALLEGKGELTVTLPSGERVTDAPERIVGRLGSAAYGGSYFTFSDENNDTIWSFLKKCHEGGHVYRGTDVMPWCTRCGTGLSQMEVAEGRQVTRHLSVFVRFPIRGREKEALLIWTTTPWTLTSNVAAAVNPDMTYLAVRCGDWTYYVGKGNFSGARVQELDAGGKREKHTLHTVESILKGTGQVEILREFSGKELLQLEYDGPFDHLDAARIPGGMTPFGPVEGIEAAAVEAHRVIPWDAVSEAEGTGIVHIAPGCGAEDQELGRREKLPAITPLAEDGTYLEGFGEWTGKKAGEIAEGLAADLKKRGRLVAKESYPHVYPHCWRCKEELVFRLVDEWFIRMDWRDRIIRIVPEIRWIPPDGEARELDWLRNMGDWMISKKRFWGLALPIWICNDPGCTAFDVVGSREELRERAIAGWEEFEGHSPHRPWIDGVKIACAACGGTASRIEDVGNPWLDAGIVPYSTLRYNTDRTYWKTWFPADFVVESFPGQFRNWFYAMLAMSTMMEDRPPFKVLLGHALVRDERGEEMHKSKGNSIPFDEAAEILGAEVMRYLYAAQPPTQNLNFPDISGDGKRGGLADETRRKLLPLWNCYGFFVTYAEVDGWTPKDDAPAVAVRPELDRWILSRMEGLVADAHTAFGDFALHRFMERFERFCDDLSNWYLRRSRRRFWRSEADADKRAAYATLYEVLTTTVRLLAPILPFFAEELHANLAARVDPDAPESVHLAPYPEFREERVDPELERAVDCVIRTKNALLALRKGAGAKIRQPLAGAKVRPRDESDRKVLADPHFARQVTEECNLKRLEPIDLDTEGDFAKRTIRPAFKRLGPRLGDRMKAVATHLAKGDSETILAATADGGVYRFEIDGESVELTAADLDVQVDGPEGWNCTIEHGAFFALDTRITPELEREGIARDFNRLAQDLRKTGGLEVADRIEIAYAAPDRIAQAIDEHVEMLKQELLATALQREASLPDGAEGRVAGESVRLTVRKTDTG